MNIPLVTKKYKGLSWFENFMGGHINIGKITIYGANAMNWAVNISTKRWGFICFTLPVLARWQPERYGGKKRYKWYFYISPNATPWAATFYMGNSDPSDKAKAPKRREALGLKFDAWNDERARLLLREINNQ